MGAVGLDNLVIVDTHDSLLVVDKNQTQDVKKIFTKLKLQEHGPISCTALLTDPGARIQF